MEGLLPHLQVGNHPDLLYPCNIFNISISLSKLILKVVYAILFISSKLLELLNILRFYQ